MKLYCFDGDGITMLVFFFFVVQNGKYLDSCVLLGSNSSYSASEDDGVFFDEASCEGPSEDDSGVTVDAVPSQNTNVSRSAEFIFELKVKYSLIFVVLSAIPVKDFPSSNTLNSSYMAFCHVHKSL